MQDGMLVAETVLYSELHQKLNQHADLGDERECDDFTSWRKKWDYLWGEPPLIVIVSQCAVCVGVES